MQQSIVEQLKHRKSLIPNEEARAILNVCKNTFNKYARQKKFLVYRIGNENQADPVSLAAYLQSREV